MGALSFFNVRTLYEWVIWASLISRGKFLKKRCLLSIFAWRIVFSLFVQLGFLRLTWVLSFLSNSRGFLSCFSWDGPWATSMEKVLVSIRLTSYVRWWGLFSIFGSLHAILVCVCVGWGPLLALEVFPLLLQKKVVYVYTPLLFLL